MINRNIKKSLLITLEFPPQHGGVATYYYNICKNLPPDKIAVLAQSYKNSIDFDSRQKFKIIRKNLVTKKPTKLLKVAATAKWLLAINHLAEAVKKESVELIQVGQILPLGTLALAYYKKKKIPYIIYTHGMDITVPQKSLRKKKLIQEILKHAAGVVANSNFTKDELVKLGTDPAKIIVVYPCPNNLPQEIDEFITDKIKTTNKIKNEKILLTVGRLVERKGQDMVIKALPKIIKKVPDLLYLIVGSGPYLKTLEKLAGNKKVADHIRFISNPNNRELATIYNIADVFIMPARRLANGDVEGFGIVYLEANSFGLPVIGGHGGGASEAILHERTGLLVNATDTEDIAEKAVALLTNKPLAERIGLQGLERVTEFFDWEQQTEKIQSILN